MSSTPQRLASTMGWTEQQIRSYYQAALNLMPIVPSIAADKPEAFYDALLQALPAEQRVQGDCYDTVIKENAVALTGIAAYHNDLRWTSALLLHDSVRPSNLDVLTNAAVERIVLEEGQHSQSGEGSVAARGVLVRVQGDSIHKNPGDKRQVPYLTVYSLSRMVDYVLLGNIAH
jgi:hypothetical protein